MSLFFDFKKKLFKIHEWFNISDKFKNSIQTLLELIIKWHLKQNDDQVTKNVAKFHMKNSKICRNMKIVPYGLDFNKDNQTRHCFLHNALTI